MPGHRARRTSPAVNFDADIAQAKLAKPFTPAASAREQIQNHEIEYTRKAASYDPKAVHP